jgi:hypothetical protein
LQVKNKLWLLESVCADKSLADGLGDPPLPNVRLNPNERTTLSGILKNREKQEKQEKGFDTIEKWWRCLKTSDAESVSAQ